MKLSLVFAGKITEQMCRFVDLQVTKASQSCYGFFSPLSSPVQLGGSENFFRGSEKIFGGSEFFFGGTP